MLRQAVMFGRGHETLFEPKHPLEIRPELLEALRDGVFPDVPGFVVK